MNTSTKTQLTSAEELEFLKLYAQTEGTKKNYYLTKLIENNLGLVHKIVSKFPMKSSNCTYEDLFQEGVLGLRHGIGKYDITRGYKLSTYVYSWIQCYVRRYYQNVGSTIRKPVHLSEKALKLNKATEELQTKLGRTPTQEEVTAIIPNADDIRSSMVESISLNQCVNEDNELEGVVGVDNTEQNDAIVDCDLLMSQLKGIVSERDYSILVSRFGLDGKGERTLKEISEVHGLTRARIHQVQNQCIAQLRKLASV